MKFKKKDRVELAGVFFKNAGYIAGAAVGAGLGDAMKEIIPNAVQLIADVGFGAGFAVISNHLYKTIDKEQWAAIVRTSVWGIVFAKGAVGQEALQIAAAIPSIWAGISSAIFGSEELHPKNRKFYNFRELVDVKHNSKHHMLLNLAVGATLLSLDGVMHLVQDGFSRSAFFKALTIVAAPASFFGAVKIPVKNGVHKISNNVQEEFSHFWKNFKNDPAVLSIKMANVRPILLAISGAIEFGGNIVGNLVLAREYKKDNLRQK